MARRLDILTTVFLRMRPRLMLTARSILGDSAQADASDALQDAFCRLWRHRGEISTERHAEGASVTAVRHAAIDALRRRRDCVGTDVLESRQQADDSADDAGDLYTRVSDIIHRHLTERERTILYMRDRHGYEIEAIAADMELTEANVRVILSRARCKVRDCYREYKTMP